MDLDSLECCANPDNLDPEERDDLKKLEKAIAAGKILTDDPTVEAYANGVRLKAAGIDITEPGYEGLYPNIESVEVHDGIEKLVRAKYGDTMAALADGKMWTPDMEGQEGMVRPPSLDEVIAILSSRLDREQIDFALNNMSDPQILLKPSTGFRRYMDMLNTGTRVEFPAFDRGRPSEEVLKKPWERKLWKQRKTFVTDHLMETLTAEDCGMGLDTERIFGWRVGIGAGKSIGPFKTRNFLALLKRWGKRFSRTGAVLASPKESALLMKLNLLDIKRRSEGVMTVSDDSNLFTSTPLRSDRNGRVLVEIGKNRFVVSRAWVNGPDFDFEMVGGLAGENEFMCCLVVMERS